MSAHHPPGSLTARVVRLGAGVNRVVQGVCVGLMAAMVLIIWLGVASRYVFGWGITWTEELSRYVMIWGALLAVSIGVFRREHIGFELLLMKLPHRAQKAARIGLDLIAIGFFSFLAVYGAAMTVEGANQYATIFGITMMVPFASVPVACGLSAFQCVVAMLRDRDSRVSGGLVTEAGR